VNLPSQPQIRPLEIVPYADTGEDLYLLRDPQGFTGTAVIAPAAALLISLMNGKRTLGELREEFFSNVGSSIPLSEIEKLVQQLDEHYLLETPRFASHKQAQIDQYNSLSVRPSAHAGGAYHSDVAPLKQQLSELFTHQDGPGLLPWEANQKNGFPQPPASRLAAIMSPHIDFHRGGASFAWAYDRIVTESDASLFVILGTAHTPLQGFYSVSRKHFATPLGTAYTDLEFIEHLESKLSSKGNNCSSFDHTFADEFPHRTEHSIEFQVLMLQFILAGRRNFQIVPILVDSFYPFIEHGRFPSESPAVADFIGALRETVEQSDQPTCYISGVDLAHIGPQFGDVELLDDQRLSAQWADDQQLLTKACAGDSRGWFEHIASQEDRNRICGLAPTYTMLEALQPHRGELLKYDQAIAEDRTSCVSFASVVFYEE